MRWLFKILLAGILSNAAGFSHAFTFRQVGVDSNLLIDGDRVVFCQSDGSLTALAVKTGQVLRRVKGHDLSGTLKRIPPGILMLQYGSIALLNPTNFTSVWKTESHYNPTVLSNALISYDGNGLVENRDLRTGTVRWSFELPGALDVIAESGKVLVHRAATYEDDRVPTTVMLDLESGKELFRKTPPSGTHWPAVFFDGQKIYLKQGSYSGKPSDYKLERLVVWDAQGEEINSIALSPKLQDELRWGSSPFDLDQKTFYGGHVYPDRWSIPNERFGRLLPRGDQANEVSEAAYDLGDGFVFLQREDRRNHLRNQATEIELRSPEQHWTGVLPYLSHRGHIAAVARAPGKLLIGSNLGHVECVNAATGESLWLYVFPTIRHVMSFSSHGMPPMMSESAAIFRNENKTPPSSGLKRVNESAKPTRVIIDPEPTNPFEKLPLLLSVTWGGAIAPLIALAFLRLHPRTRQWNLGLISVLVLALVFGCFMSYGRVSPGSSIALRIAMLAVLVMGVADAVKYIRSGKWFLGAVIVGIFTCVALLMLPFMLRI